MNVDGSEDADACDVFARTRQQEFLPGPPPRPVDKEQIRALHAGELPRELELEVRDLTVAFRDWAEASREVLLERIAALPTDDPDGTHATPAAASSPSNTLAWISVAAAAALLVCIALALWYPRGEDRLAALDVRVLSSPTRGAEPATELPTDDDTFRLSGRDFYLQIASPTPGYVSILLHSAEGTRSYPPPGSPLIATAYPESIEYGPLLKSKGAVIVAVVVTSQELTSQIELLVREHPPASVPDMRRTLANYFASRGTQDAHVAVFLIVEAENPGPFAD